MQTQLEGHRELTTNVEALLVSPNLRAFLPIFRNQFVYFSLFHELSGLAGMKRLLWLLKIQDYYLSSRYCYYFLCSNEEKVFLSHYNFFTSKTSSRPLERWKIVHLGRPEIVTLETSSRGHQDMSWRRLRRFGVQKMFAGMVYVYDFSPFPTSFSIDAYWDTHIATHIHYCIGNIFHI